MFLFDINQIFWCQYQIKQAAALKWAQKCSSYKYIIAFARSHGPDKIKWQSSLTRVLDNLRPVSWLRLWLRMENHGLKKNLHFAHKITAHSFIVFQTNVVKQSRAHEYCCVQCYPGHWSESSVWWAWAKWLFYFN